jgi:hypothetical protein
MRDLPRPPERDWFNPVAEFLGTAYLRNAFTNGRAVTSVYDTEARQAVNRRLVLPPFSPSRRREGDDRRRTGKSAPR